MKKQLGLILGTVLGMLILTIVWNPFYALATEADPTTAGAQDVDYDVVVQSQDGELNLRSGPGAEYSLLHTHHNGDVLHIYKVKNAASGNPWGYTLGGPNRDIIGWVALAPTARAEAQTPETSEEAPASTEAPVAETPEETTSVEETAPAEETTSEETVTSEEEPTSEEAAASEEEPTSEEETASTEEPASAETPAEDSTESAISAAPSVPPSSEDLPAAEEETDNNYVLSRAIAGIAIIAAAIVAMRVLHVRNTRRRRRRR
ncbi:MAG: hypothetical protein J5935_01335 [Lachnospiraceae bacterium]|nr:hypothetical protein [Lachnospiraceae bacterium]